MFQGQKIEIKQFLMLFGIQGEKLKRSSEKLNI